jgi:hypothetical protein
MGQGARPAPPAIRQVALIIGAMKCGTTSLFDHLSRHPEICASARKEPMFFSRDGWTDGMDAYRRLWPDFDPARHKFALEASTEYSKWPDLPNVAPRIKAFADANGIRFKFIYIVRDPLKMIDSGLGHGQDRNWSKSNRDRLLRHLSRVADFDAQLACYRDCFPPEDIHVLQLEKLVTDPGRELAAIAGFLGLAADFGPAGGAVRSNSAADRRQMRSARAAIERLGPVGALARLLPEPARQRLRPAARRLLGRMLGQSVPVADWRLTAAEREEIARMLQPGLLALEQGYGIDRRMWEAAPSSERRLALP